MNSKGIITVQFYLIFIETHPTERYFTKLCAEEYAIYWREIGLELAFSSSGLDNILINNANHPNKVQECCKSMFRKWLLKEPRPTWQKLFDAKERASKQDTKGKQMQS